MKVLILGGGGRVARSMINDLMGIDPEEDLQIVAADRRYEIVKEVIDEYRSDKLTPAAIDVTDHVKLVEMMKGFDVVINSTTPAGSIPAGVLKAALEARVNIIDLGAWPEETRQSMALNDDFEKAGLTAILGLGSSPGIMNLITRNLVDKLDTVETIELSFGYSIAGASTVPISVPFEGAFTEFTAEPLIFRGGKFEELPPQSGLTDIQYPEPIGVRRSFYIGHSEIFTFPQSFKDKGIKNVSMWAGFTTDFVEKANFLIDIGIINEEAIKVDNTSVVPMDVLVTCLDRLPPERGEVEDCACSRVVVIGEKDSEKMEYTALMPSKMTVGHRTGIPPAIGARMLYKGEITKKGVFPPESGVEPKPFFKELTRRGLEVSITSRTFM